MEGVRTLGVEGDFLYGTAPSKGFSNSCKPLSSLSIVSGSGLVYIPKDNAAKKIYLPSGSPICGFGQRVSPCWSRGRRELGVLWSCVRFEERRRNPPTLPSPSAQDFQIREPSYAEPSLCHLDRFPHHDTLDEVKICSDFWKFLG